MFIARGVTVALSPLDKVDAIKLLRDYMEKHETARFIITWLRGGERRLYIELEDGRPVACIYDDGRKVLYGEECFRTVVDEKLLEDRENGYLEIIRLLRSAVELDREYVSQAFTDNVDTFLEYIERHLEKEKIHKAPEEPGKKEVTATTPTTSPPVSPSMREKQLIFTGLRDKGRLSMDKKRYPLEIDLTENTVCDPLQISSLLMRNAVSISTYKQITIDKLAHNILSLKNKYDIYVSAITKNGEHIRIYIRDGRVKSLSIEKERNKILCNKEALAIITEMDYREPLYNVKIFIYKRD